MQVICVANQKGGCGKSTTADALAAYLSRTGRVLAIDLDAQCNLTEAYGLDPYAGGRSVLEHLTGACTLPDAIKQARKDIVPGSHYLTPDALGKGHAEGIRRLKKGLSAISTAYDYVVIDTPPGISLLTLSALTAADAVLIPAAADLFSIRAIEEMLKTVDTVRRANSGLRVAGILLTRHNPRSNISKFAAEQIEELAKAKGVPLLPTFIRECVSIREAQAFGKDIYTYAPRSNAASDYDAAFNSIFTTNRKGD